jgi:triacylglycerol esterase/lipase EstA (alpha/beta hydrolase family)
MANRDGSAPNKCHIVLLPGFGGFDALGRVNYYAGITRLFQRWVKRHPQADAMLHYFDNLPTAAVVTRAERLRKYLAKRMARGEMRDGENIILVGHSTGGLDIRRLG